MIFVENVEIRHRRTVAIKDLSFEWDVGLLGVLGPNGAGKTTLFQAMATLHRPTAGSIRIAGFDTKLNQNEVRRHIGYLPQIYTLMRNRSLLDNVEYAAWANAIAPRDVNKMALKALSMVDLSDKAHLPVRKLSGGQRQRLGIACAIAHQPPVLILDEPTVGLDPLQRIELRRVIRAIADHHSVVLSTHIVSDIENYADSAVILDSGEIRAFAQIDEIAGAYEPTEHLSALEQAYLDLVLPNGKDSTR